MFVPSSPVPHVGTLGMHVTLPRDKSRDWTNLGEEHVSQSPSLMASHRKLRVHVNYYVLENAQDAIATEGLSW